jgi:hypothetical protein
MLRAILAAAFFLFAVHATGAGADPAGTWKGEYETPTGPGAMELTFSRAGDVWKAVCKFPEVEDENTFAARDLKVSDAEISFRVVAGEQGNEMRFNGKPAGDKIEGTLERFVDGKSEYTGRWSVERPKPPANGAKQ